jgi:hypothetical protein
MVAKKTLVVFFTVLLLVSVFLQKTPAQTISAQINENSTVGSCTHPVGSCTSCYTTFTFDIVWTRTTPAGYQWTPVMYAGQNGSNGIVIGQGNADQGSDSLISFAGSYAGAPCNKWLKAQEQSVNYQNWNVWGQVTAPDGTKTVVRSNNAQVSNPSGT